MKAQQPITVTSPCMGQVQATHHSLAMEAVPVDAWFGHMIKAVPLADGGSVVMNRYIAGPDTGVQVTRSDAMGALVWNYSFTDAGIGYMQPMSMCLANDDGYIIAGQTAGYTNDWDPFLLKLDAAGNFSWFKTYSCSRNLQVQDVSQSLNGNICMVGCDYYYYTAWATSQWNTFFVATENAAVVMVTDNVGAPVSFKPYSFHFGGVDRKWEHFDDVEPLSGGGFLIAGNSGHNWDFFAATMLMIDDAGNQQWCRNWVCTQFGGTWSSDVAQCALQASPTTGLIAGYVSDHNQYGTGWSYRDAFATQVDLSNGDLAWSKRYMSTAAQVSDGVLSNGHLLITGYKLSANSTMNGGVLYDVNSATGALNQLRTYHYEASPGALFQSVDAYSNGDLLFAGQTSRNGFRQALVQKTDASGTGACTDSLWTTPGTVDLNWTERLMTINDAGGQNPSPLTTIATTAVDRSLTRTCACILPSTFCAIPPDTLFVLDKDTLVCASDTLHIASFLEDQQLCNVDQFTYAWEYFADGSVANNVVIGGTSFETFTGAVPPALTAPVGSTSVQVQLIVVDCAGDTACKVAASVGIGGGQSASTALGPDTAFCGGPLLLGPGSTDSTATFEWYVTALGGDLSQAQSGGTIGTDASYNADSSGVYFLITEVNGCASLDSIIVDMAHLNIELIDSALFCVNDSTVLDATWPGATAYTWSGVASGTLPTALVYEEGNAIVVVESGDCVGTDTVAVSEQALPVLDLPDRVPLCIDTHVAHLEITDPHDSAAWSTGASASWINVTEDGYFSASIFENGCRSMEDSVLVYWDDCTCAFYLPNSFTPDGDGINETWAPVMECDLRSMDLLIFNRWGELIAELKAPVERWDGTYGGQACPIGVYPYKLKYASNHMVTGTIDRVERFGHVNLIR